MPVFESWVYAKLPRAGLGNKMLVWARALVFAELNRMPLFVSGWADVKIGPYLRREKTKRQYWGYFTAANRIGWLRQVLYTRLFRVTREPELRQLADPPRSGQAYVFDTMTSWEDYFGSLHGHEQRIRDAFFKQISPGHMAALADQAHPVIGVHVRRSDFRDAAQGEGPGQACNVRTPIDYHVGVVRELRALAGQDLPVTVFTDGSAQDVAALLALPHVKLAAPNPDIVDLLLLSRARCIVVSAASTFSYWAAFLSDAAVVLHPAHSAPIRSPSWQAHCFEGALQEAGPQARALLTRQLGGLERGHESRSSSR